jgi:hypothetical protein
MSSIGMAEFTKFVRFPCLISVQYSVPYYTINEFDFKDNLTIRCNNCNRQNHIKNHKSIVRLQKWPKINEHDVFLRFSTNSPQNLRIVIPK